MPYEQQQWNNGDTSTPLSAQRLDHMEAGIAAAVENSPEGRQALASSAELSATIAEQMYTLPVFDFLDGDPLPTATTGDIGAAMNRALAAAQALADADPNGTYVVGVPAGKYRMTTGLGILQPRSVERVGIRGAGKMSTVFVLVGNISFFNPRNSAQTPGSLSEYAVEECVFSDFSVDMTAGPAVDPTGASYKVFKGAGWLRCRFERIYGFGSSATGFGNDYLVDSVFESCTIRDAGRGWPESFDYWANGSCSGFGIATGWSEEESATFIDCHAIDNRRSGFLFEYQHQHSTSQRQRFTLIGCSATGNYMGLSMAGAAGLQASGCQFNGNTIAGVYVGVNEASPVAGKDVELVGCDLTGNRFGFYATAVSSWGFSPADATPLECAGGTRIVNSKIRDNTEHGIYVRQMRLGEGGFHVVGNTITDNGGSGVRMERAHGDWKDVRVTDNDFTGQDRHLDLLVPLTAPTVRGNAFHGGDVGMAYHPAETSTEPIQAGNTFYDVAADVEVALGSLASVAADRSPAAAAFGHHEYLGIDGIPFGEAGWLDADLQGTEATWTATTAGVQPSGASGLDALKYRDLGTAGTFIEVWLRNATSAASPARMAVVSYTGPGDDPHTTPERRHFVGAGVYNTLSSFYAMFQFDYTGSGYPTLLWESSVPIEEAHVVGIREKAPGSTVRQMFIDGQLVHEQDVPTIPATQYAGVYGIVTSSQNRRIQIADMAAL